MSYPACLDVPALTLRTVTRWITAAYRAPVAARCHCLPPGGPGAALVASPSRLVLPGRRRWDLDRHRLPVPARGPGGNRRPRPKLGSCARPHPRRRCGLPMPGRHAGFYRPRRWAHRAVKRHLVLGQEPPLRRKRPGHHRPQRFPLVELRCAPCVLSQPGLRRKAFLSASVPSHHAIAGRPHLGHIGAGTGIHVPIKRPRSGRALHDDNRTYSQFLTALRASAKRANALLQGWRALLHITLDSQRITTITAAALVTT